MLFYMPFRPAFDGNAKFIPGAQIWFTLVGTNTPTPVYSDVALTTPRTNPVVADAIGQIPATYMDESIDTRVRIYDADAVAGVDAPIEDYDPYIPIEGTLANGAVDIDDLALETGADNVGADMVGWLQSGAGATGRTVRDKLREVKSVKDFGATGDGVTDDTLAIQAALDTGGNIIVPPGSYLVSDTLSFSVQATQVFGGGHFASRIEMNSLDTGIIEVGEDHCHLHDLSVNYTGGTPIAGASAITIGANYFSASGVMVRSAFDGFTIIAASSVFLNNIHVLDYENTAIYARDVVLDLYVDGFYLNCGVGTRGDLGAIRLSNQVEAAVFSNGEVLQGKYGLTTAATSNTAGNRPAYCKFSNVYFDSATDGCVIDKAVEIEFVNCWFSNRPLYGISLSNCDGIKFHGGGAMNCGTHGVLVNSTAVRTTFNGFSARGNSQASAGVSDGIAIAAGTTDFLITNCILGGSLGFGTQRYGAWVDTGASDRYIIADNLVTGNGTGGVLDNGTGVNKRVANNY
jgi:hypothetical protein